MRSDPLELDASPPPDLHPDTHPDPDRRTGLSRLDKDGVLLALTGGSVVDWSGASFQTHEDVNAFLRLWHCDITRHTWARERFRYLYNQAINYLEEHLGLHFRPQIRRPVDVREAFLGASARGRFVRDRIQFCAVLKLMHVINHLEMQELRSSLPIREVDLLEHANLSILARAEQMRQEGFPLQAFYGNRKTRPSVISKLLQKRENTAATVFDKLRFRIVTQHRDHLIPALAWLLRNLIPFPAIIPGESHNSLLTRDEVLAATDTLPELGRVLSRGLDALKAPENRFSGAGYRVINFVAGLPVRVYDLPGLPPPAYPALLGEAVPVLVEFQLIDAETDAANEQGESRHDRYKARQMETVEQRLGRTIAGRLARRPGAG